MSYSEKYRQRKEQESTKLVGLSVGRHLRKDLKDMIEKYGITVDDAMVSVKGFCVGYISSDTGHNMLSSMCRAIRIIENKWELDK